MSKRQISILSLHVHKVPSTHSGLLGGFSTAQLGPLTGLRKLDNQYIEELG